MKKKISIAITDFAIPAPKVGSIDTYSGFSAGQTFGIDIHHEIQASKHKDECYEAEVWTFHRFTHKKIMIEVLGKIDGIYHQKPIKIEEIKTAFDLNKLQRYLKENSEHHPFCLQLRTYGYIYYLKTGEMPDLNLHLVSSRNRKSIDFPISLDIETYQRWLKCRLEELVAEYQFTQQRIKRRKKIAKNVHFPFVTKRKGQDELIQSIEFGMEANSPMLIQAPTGLGKTMGILFPVLKEALTRGQKVIYLTPKNSQHRVAIDAVKQLQAQGLKLHYLNITAKKKICMKEEPICNADYCEFAQDHYSKVSKHQILPQLHKEKKLTSYTFRKYAECYQVCPYELQMDAIYNADTVICDYNYVFSPRASANKISSLTIGEEEKPNLVVDEIHNLPARAMDYYSPVLSILILEKLACTAENIPIGFRDKFLQLIDQSIAIIQSSKTAKNYGPHFIQPNIKVFAQHEGVIREFMGHYLELDEVAIAPNDIVLALFNLWSDFTAALEFVIQYEDEFFVAYHPPGEIRITCCDAGEMLKACYVNFKHTIGFSATLKPFDYYSKLIGLYSKKLMTEEFPSPFPKQNRKLLIIPQISSKYSDRERNYPRIAQAIAKITELKTGNYFAFFPSFDFMNRVLHIFTPGIDFNVRCQTRNMPQTEIQQLIAKLTDPANGANIIFAVQGGVFSEGVDYPGEVAIGAFVVGTPLPIYDWQREQMRAYYEKKYEAGMDYAYTYPAMAKAVQAAGRVIRSETDKGIIVLMDNRFLQPNYAKCMPKDWFDEDPNEIVSTKILEEIHQFWTTQSC